jgi:rhamnogalacturonyl hydrolase YesR
MKEIKKKIKELLLFNSDKRGMNIMEQIEFHISMFNELKELAKKHDTILGRTITFPIADGYSIYLITKINKVTVTVRWIDYADGWFDKRVGEKGLLNIDFVLNDIRGQDMLNKNFKKIKMKKERKYLIEIAGQYLILNELEYEKYLIYGVLT